MAPTINRNYPTDDMGQPAPGPDAGAAPVEAVPGQGPAPIPGVDADQEMQDAEVMIEMQKQIILTREEMLNRLTALSQMINIAEEFKDDKELQGTMSARVLEDYEMDLASRSDWDKSMKEAVKLAKMLHEDRLYGGEKVASVDYPLVSEACINFNARAYPEIVKDTAVVKAQIIGNDDSGEKRKKGDRVAAHMSFQILNQMGAWEDDEDQMLITLPLMGVSFKKTYRNSLEMRNESNMVFPEDLVVHYYAKTVETAPRLTHIIELSKNEIIERINAGVFLDFDIKILGNPTAKFPDQDVQPEANDEDAPHVFLEQHTWYDYDNDGYKEPYIITIYRDTRTIVRMVARYDFSEVKTDEQGNIIKINPVHYFTRFIFLPAPDGSFYGMGFGSLLSSMNFTINSSCNQLLDAGTRQNRPGGFLSRGLRVGRGEGGNEIKVKPGEWKYVSALGDDLRKNVVPMPTGNPSPVLFKLLEFLINSGKDIAMMADVLSGQAPGSNVPAATVVSLIEQGLKAYTGVFKRIHRGHKSEFNKIKRLNRLHLEQEEYQNILDDPEANKKADYENIFYDIVPVSDPQNATDIQRLMKAQSLLQLKGSGLNDMEINRRFMEALGIQNIDDIMPKDDIAEEQMKQLTIERLIATIDNLKSQTALTTEKIKTEEVNQAVKSAGVELDKTKIMLEAMQKSQELKVQNMQARLSGASANKKAQGPYEERGMQTNNVRQ